MRFHWLPIFLTAACLAFAAQAQDVPHPRPPAPAVPGERLPTEKRAWMGVSVLPAPASLRHQLKLPEGTGLVVEFVQPKSPADQGGLKQYDVLEKLDDQVLVNPEQFAVLVRLHKPADEVKLIFLREGKEQTASVKLIEHDVPPLGEWDRPAPWMGGRFVAPPGMPQFAPWRQGRPGGAVGSQRSVTWVDGHRQITITTTDGHTTLLVTENPGGKVIFQGPIDTQEQRKMLPPDVRETLDHLQSWLGSAEGKEPKAPDSGHEDDLESR